MNGQTERHQHLGQLLAGQLTQQNRSSKRAQNARPVSVAQISRRARSYIYAEHAAMTKVAPI